MEKSIFFMIIFCLTALLAVSCAEPAQISDRLVGVFITAEHLNLPGTLGRQENDYSGRQYADFNEDTREYAFKDIIGIPFMSPLIETGGESYTGLISDGRVDASRLEVKVGDTNEMNMEGTIFTVPSGPNVLYINPVYQERDGRVYLTGGNGSSFSGYDTEGSNVSTAIESTDTVNENGEVKTSITLIKISMGIMFPPETIVIMEMDSMGVLLTREEYEPGFLPNNITPDADTAFIVAETIKRDIQGNLVIQRNIYDSDDEYIETYYAGEDGFCVRLQTPVGPFSEEV